MEASDIPRPVRVAGEPVLEAGAPVVWFTFPGAHHDVGRFHTPGGQLTGFYVNILTPVEFLPSAPDGADVWRTTDLFVDLFITPGREVHLLDRDELRRAAREGYLSRSTAREALVEARRLTRLARRTDWPPPVVEEWTLRRARAAAAGSVSE